MNLLLKRLITFVFFITITLSVFAGDTRPGKDQTQILPRVQNGNFVLNVSNQSPELSPVDITIQIDGTQEVSDEFHVRNQHNWIEYTFQLSPGKHNIRAVSRKGDASLEQVVDLTKKLWAVIDFTYRPGMNEKKEFSFTCRDKPIFFD